MLSDMFFSIDKERDNARVAAEECISAFEVILTPIIFPVHYRSLTISESTFDVHCWLSSASSAKRCS